MMAVSHSVPFFAGWVLWSSRIHQPEDQHQRCWYAIPRSLVDVQSCCRGGRRPAFAVGSSDFVEALRVQWKWRGQDWSPDFGIARVQSLNHCRSKLPNSDRLVTKENKAHSRVLLLTQFSRKARVRVPPHGRKKKPRLWSEERERELLNAFWVTAIVFLFYTWHFK